MCGILIVAASGRDRPAVDERTVARMRDRMVHRGPDGAGLQTAGAAILAHRRLSVIDPEGGAQPWIEPPLGGDRGGSGAEDELVLVYNGELYEADALRRSLPGSFRSHCDTEVLARLLQVEGARGLDRVRGMFAFAAWWPARRRLLLARDPLGIKPLLWAVADAPGGPEIIAASEVGAILDHPWMRCEPDWAVASAYLTTIRLTLDDRTLHAGVRTVRPGERIEFDLSGPSPRAHHAIDPRLDAIWPCADPGIGPGGDPASDPGHDATDDADHEDAELTHAIARTLRDSIHAHTVADVPVGAMLSGGLDSSIVCAELAPRSPGLRTWCATGPADVDPEADDAAHAELVAGRIGSDHRTVTISRAMFRERWPWLVEQMGVPLGTPNEVAIHAVAGAARRSVTVLLSGEGADELFAGYGPAVAGIMRAADEARFGSPVQTATSRLLHLISWIPAGLKDRVLTAPVLAAANHDDHLIDHLSMLTVPADARPSDPRPLIGVLGRLNLAGLLARLDSATMRASIEGRTPLADVAVALAAARVPLTAMAGPRTPAGVVAGRGAGAAAADGSAASFHTKRILRRAWAGQLPEAVTERPKRSFPLPFTEWVGDQASVLRESATARAVFTPEAVETVAGDPAGHALAAWPMINLALWLRRWD
jgi:asparagine synthase (glutamine-hydrolysing)